MEGIFQTVITTSLYASVTGFIIILFKSLLDKRLNPKWHFLIWTVLIIKLIIPYGPESAFSLFNAVSRVTDQNPVTQAYDQSYLSGIPSGIILPQNPENISQKDISQETEMLAPHSTGSISKARMVVPFVWLFGAVSLILWLLYTGYSLHKRLRKPHMEVPESVCSILEDCKKRMGVKRDIRIIIQERIQAPSIFGALTPKILITPQILELSEKEISYVLLHELAHYKRKDLLTNYLLLGLQAVHWFNPVIWYFFRMIRRDMEIAIDDHVLSVLKRGEEKEYGKALLAVLESLNVPRFLPKLIGMVEDKKNIKKRIDMIKAAELFRRKKGFFLLTGVICVAVLGIILLTNPVPTDTPSANPMAKEYNADVLLEYKNPYVGNASNVINLLSELPFSEFRQKISLQTENRPYGITVDYEFNSSGADLNQLEAGMYNNALVIFALVDNVDLIEFRLYTNTGKRNLNFSREELQQGFAKDLREYTLDQHQFEVLLNSIRLKLLVNPQKYTPAMSSTPGIRLTVEFDGTVDKVHFYTPIGSFRGWHQTTGRVSDLGSNVEVSPDSPVYWSPSNDNGNQLDQGEGNQIIPVSVSLVRDNAIIAEKKLIIQYDGSGFYTVEPGYDVLVGQNIHQAISQAIKDHGNYLKGEVATEGHILLSTEEKDGIITAYTIASFGYFGFENGVFTKISGSGAIPTVITFKRNEQGQYSLISYQEPLDGAGYLDSVKEMFPEKYWSDVFPEGNGYPELARQQEEQAERYLKSIGRTAPVSASHVEKKLINISSISASNKLFAELTKYDAFLNSCPYWIGTREKIEEGVRYIYETKQAKTDDGNDLIIFSKSKEDGTVVQEAHYEIIGDDPRLIYTLSEPSPAP